MTYTVYRRNGATITPVIEDVSALQYTTTGATDTYQVVAAVNGGTAVRSGWTVGAASNPPPERVPGKTPRSSDNRDKQG